MGHRSSGDILAWTYVAPGVADSSTQARARDGPLRMASAAPASSRRTPFALEGEVDPEPHRPLAGLARSPEKRGAGSRAPFGTESDVAAAFLPASARANAGVAAAAAMAKVPSSPF